MIALVTVVVLMIGGEDNLVGERGVLLRYEISGVSVFEDSVSNCDRAVLFSGLLDSDSKLDARSVVKIAADSECSYLVSGYSTGDVGCSVGDVNCDGVYDSRDVNRLAECVKGFVCEGDDRWVDMNSDGLWTMQDLIELTSCIADGTCDNDNRAERHACWTWLPQSLNACGPNIPNLDTPWQPGNGLCLNEWCNNTEVCLYIADELRDNFWENEEYNNECANVAPNRDTCCFFSGDGEITSPEECDPGATLTEQDNEENTVTYNPADGSCTNGCNYGVIPSVCNEEEIAPEVDVICTNPDGWTNSMHSTYQIWALYDIDGNMIEGETYGCTFSGTVNIDTNNMAVCMATTDQFGGGWFGGVLSIGDYDYTGVPQFSDPITFICETTGAACCPESCLEDVGCVWGCSWLDSSQYC